MLGFNLVGFLPRFQEQCGTAVEFDRLRRIYDCLSNSADLQR
jgi:hypothetical protein